MVSVIIPVYNTEKYLQCCLQSICEQSYKNIEIIIIDDGSTDNSYTICDSFKQKDSRIKLFRKENGGVSSARNMGLSKIKGDFITFVDSDDWLELTCIESQLNYKSEEEYTYDITLCEFRKLIDKNIISANEYVLYNALSFSEGGAALHGKLFRAKTIKTSGIFFDESLTIGEDMVFFVEYVLQHKSLAYHEITNTTYNYRYVENSAVNNLNSNKFNSNMLTVVQAMDKVDELSANAEYTKLLYALNIRRAIIYKDLIRKMAVFKLYKDNNFINYKKFIRRNFFEVLFSTVPKDKKSKISYILSAVSPKLELVIYLKLRNKFNQ